MSFLELARSRYSVRKYQDREVEQEKIVEVLEAGRIAPSACNYQPWKFVVVQDAQNRKRLQEIYPREWFGTAPVVIIVCGDHNKSWVRNDAKDHCDIDVAIAADHMTLAATDLGLGTCWVCAFDKEKCAEILNLESNLEPVIVLPLGYPADKVDPGRHSQQRNTIDQIVQWEF
jgi:nitroreductase